MVDALGSRSLLRSQHWEELGDAGVKLAVALPIGNPLLRAIAGRIDIRNHRKIVVIDDKFTYCGSQNCADPEFVVKEKYGPWVDLVLRLEGPIVRQKLVVTTPYYVPNESMQSALCAAGYRGVDTTIMFPATNDSWIVAGASRSYYEELLEAGVKIFEYAEGLLHAKSLTVDGEVTLIGSANMDRRSFELNYENNILLYDAATTKEVYDRQMAYLSQSKQVLLEWASRPSRATSRLARSISKTMAFV